MSTVSLFTQEASFEVASGTFDLFSMQIYIPIIAPFALRGYDVDKSTVLYSTTIASMGIGWQTIDLSAFQNIAKFEIDVLGSLVFNTALDDIQIKFN